MLKYLVTVIGVPNPSLTAQNRRSSMINHGGPEEGLIPLVLIHLTNFLT
jgi:hypothetical protein